MPTQKQIVEALLFASDSPVGLSTLVEVLEGPGPEATVALLQELGRDLCDADRGVVLVQLAGRHQVLAREERPAGAVG